MHPDHFDTVSKEPLSPAEIQCAVGLGYVATAVMALLLPASLGWNPFTMTLGEVRYVWVPAGIVVIAGIHLVRGWRLTRFSRKAAR